MKFLPCALLALILLASFCLPANLLAAINSANPALAQDHAVSASSALWTSAKAKHVYGLPDLKPNKQGTLTLTADALTFSGKSGNASIARTSVTAVSAGNQRVELWGVGGRILRMTIPDGGGLAAAAVMHHRIDTLTVEFHDSRGGSQAAVFFLPANEADRALQSFALSPVPLRQVSDAVCQNAGVESKFEPKSVLVSAPDWDRASVPAAYRALVYEHLVDHLRRTKEVGNVYRDGETIGQGQCPQYTVHIAIASFKEGSSVQRAFMGPVGMFVGTTQMKFDVAFTDATGKLNANEQITATMRGESESTNVADHVAKNVAKRYAIALKNVGKSSSVKAAGNPVS